MRAKEPVTLLKSGNRLVVSPTTPKIHDLLAHELTFTEKHFFHGWELRQRKINRELPFEMIDWECFGEDHRGRLACGWGFWHRIRRLLKAAGYPVRVRDLLPHPRPEVFEPQWHRLKEFGIKLKYGQDDFLVAFFANRGGRLSCPPAFGKSFMIGVIGLLCPFARIDVVSRRVPVIRERIYPELMQMLPDVGIVGGGMRDMGHRVMCYTVGSMHHSPADCDLLIGDEGHELVADDAAKKFGRWDRSRNYAFSATFDMRMDGKDLRGEGIFGPMIYAMDTQEATQRGLVAPVEVRWSPVVMDMDPCEGARDDIEKNRLGIWTNDYRNDIIAADALSYADDVQTLITCSTLEHAVNLKKRLPNFQLVYREDGMHPKDRSFYVKHGFIPRNEPDMSITRRQWLTRMFEKGKLKKAICTTVWNVGVNFKDLPVLIRADAGGSAINDTQIPGRTMRKGTDGNKVLGIVHDYEDQFNTGFERKAKGREKNYVQTNHWKQVHRGSKHSALAQRMLWDDE